jgi:hypothetical protein
MAESLVRCQTEKLYLPLGEAHVQGHGRTREGRYDGIRCRPRQTAGSVEGTWSTAKKQAGVECRIHDLRHHFI